MIKIEHLMKSYGEKKLFNDFNLEVRKGEFVVISGSSGSGKTTLINIIGGLECFDSGAVVVNGVDLAIKMKSSESSDFYQNTIGFLFQNFALIEDKTVKQNIDIVKKKAMNRITPKEALEKVGLQGYDNKKVYTLSGGEQQRVAIARLMLKKCCIILADEPTCSLDRKNSDIVIKYLLNLSKEENKTVLVATHDTAIKELGTRLIEL